MIDPNPRHRARAIKILKSNGIKVKAGVLAGEIRMVNQPFIKYITTDLPYITVKSAQSLDGKIATRSGDSKWITSEASRKFSRQIRNNFDAIMVGINTVLKDNPLLNPDRHIKGKKFYKIVLDTNLKINSRMHIFNECNVYPVVIATSRDSILKKPKAVKSLVAKGAIVLGAEKKNGLLDAKDLLKKLAQLEIINILAEGGAKLIGSLIDEDLADYVLFFISPKIIGGKDAVTSVQGRGVDKLSSVKKIRNVKIKNLGEDLLIEGAIKEY
jgi:diaminohydroxyphosphoribosylaminopyrimidine deaminase/5-amino-6-(5-phosphoribosylamino)uracil reductase